MRNKLEQKLNELERKLDDGLNELKKLKARKISEKEFQNKYGSWKNHASHGNTVKLVHSMDLHIKSEIEKG